MSNLLAAPLNMYTVRVSWKVGKVVGKEDTAPEKKRAHCRFVATVDGADFRRGMTESVGTRSSDWPSRLKAMKYQYTTMHRPRPWF
jgi:hypothetical protein